MELISIPLRKLDRMYTQRYADKSGIKYVVTKSPFRKLQYGVHLELMDTKGKVYQKIEVYFAPEQTLSDPFEANGGQYRIALVTK